MDSITRIWHLMARALNNEASPHELQEFSELLSQDSSLQQQYEVLSRIWQEKDLPDEDGNIAKTNIERIIRKAETINPQADHFAFRRRRRRRGIYITVLLLCVASASTWIWMMNRPTLLASANESKEAIIAKNGSRSRSLLPDGTTVWLNAGSKLYYESDFSGSTREVVLEGEAFFDVVKNPSRPFIVHTGDVDIKVLGTSFNVKSYPEDKTVETTLYHGHVNVSRQGEDKKSIIELKPNQKLVLPKEATAEMAKLPEQAGAAAIKKLADFTITRIDSTKKENERFETAWLYSRLEFRGDSFPELALKLERWYNVNIVFTDEKVKGLHLNGSFERETVEQAFAALKEGFPITYKINNNEISVGSSE